MVQRLSQRDWVSAGLKALAAEGYGSLRAERLAKQLGVSRGSFYWHFPNVDGFEEAVLAEWEIVAVDSPYDRATAKRDAASQTSLRILIEQVFEVASDLERAVRTWAATSTRAALTVQKADQRRISLLTELMPAGMAAEDRQAQAKILYWAYLGHVATPAIEVDDVSRAALVDLFAPTSLGGTRRRS